MTKYFKVAEHTFALDMQDTCSLWQRLTQYDPFVTDAPEGEPLFRLELVQDAYEPNPDRQVVYDVPTEEGETVVKLYREPGGWSFDMSPEKSIPFRSHMRATEDFSSGRLYLDNRRVSDAVFGINNSMMLLYAFRSAPLDTLELHASMVSNSGKFLCLRIALTACFKKVVDGTPGISTGYCITRKTPSRARSSVLIDNRSLPLKRTVPDVTL